MISNFCEDQRISDTLTVFHEKTLQEYGIPKWANLQCPFCCSELPLRSIRAISLRFNTRNLGDVAVEIFCTRCNKMDTLYFRNVAQNIDDFILLLQGQKIPSNVPVIEEIMFKQAYNNAMDKMMSGR